MKKINGLFLMVVLSSCTTEDNNTLSFRMDNGEKITIGKDLEDLNIEVPTRLLGIKSLATQIEGHEVTFDAKKGYTSCDSTECYRKVSFTGNCTTYGLDPNKVYYCRVEYYMQSIPCRSDENAISYCPKGLNMGLSVENIGIYTKPRLKIPVGIDASISIENKDGAVQGYTAILNIKCDGLGHPVNIYYPANPHDLDWRFGRVKKIYLEEIEPL